MTPQGCTWFYMDLNGEFLAPTPPAMRHFQQTKVVRRPNYSSYSGLGTGGELWSGIMTQYCDGSGVSSGATSCSTKTAHVAYPTIQVFSGLWYDSSVASPISATGNQLAKEAIKVRHISVTRLPDQIAIRNMSSCRHPGRLRTGLIQRGEISRMARLQRRFEPLWRTCRFELRQHRLHEHAICN